MRVLLKFLVPLSLAASASLLVAPAAQGDCIGPGITATIGLDGELVVRGKGFGTQCYDGPPPPDGQGTLGPPASDISVVVRQQGVEWQVALGDAEADYTFQVEAEPPPLAGVVDVEARFADQRGLLSLSVASTDLTLPASGSLTGGTTVTPFGEQSTEAAETSSRTVASKSDTPGPGSRVERVSTPVITTGLGFLAGLLVSIVAVVYCQRRRSTSLESSTSQRKTLRL